MRARGAGLMRRRSAHVSAPRSGFVRFRFPPDVITAMVRWYLQVRALVSRRGGAAGRTRDPGRSRHHLSVGTALHPAADRRGPSLPARARGIARARCPAATSASGSALRRAPPPAEPGTSALGRDYSAGEDRSIRPQGPWPNLATQDHDLVSQHRQLGSDRRVAAGQDDQPSNQAHHDQIEKPKTHVRGYDQRCPCRGGVEGAYDC
jgi:hypothetical protein